MAQHERKESNRGTRPNENQNQLQRSSGCGESLWREPFAGFWGGLKKDDVKVDITDDSLTIEGERREEHEEDREGCYRSERSYGSFCRVIPLPDGAITDSAKANFNNGVLEIVMQAPLARCRAAEG